MLLECVSKRKIRKFEWILRQFKEETRRLSSAKSRVDDAEMAQKTPKLRIREFLRHTLKCKKNSPTVSHIKSNLWGCIIIPSFIGTIAGNDLSEYHPMEIIMGVH